MVDENTDPNRVAIYRDVENLETPEEFVQAVY
jgi:hypothetical protein